MATIIEIIAQTITNSTKEKPVSGDLLTLCFGIEFDMVSTFRRGSKVKTALEQFPLRKCLFSLDFTLGLETGGGLTKNACVSRFRRKSAISRPIVLVGQDWRVGLIASSVP